MYQDECSRSWQVLNPQWWRIHQESLPRRSTILVLGSHQGDSPKANRAGAGPLPRPAWHWVARYRLPRHWCCSIKQIQIHGDTLSHAKNYRFLQRSTAGIMCEKRCTMFNLKQTKTKYVPLPSRKMNQPVAQTKKAHSIPSLFTFSDNCQSISKRSCKGRKANGKRPKQNI